MTRRGSSRYCKDQHELEDYLIGEGVEGAMLTLGSGAQVAGEDLRRLVEEARRAGAVLGAFPTNYPRFVIEQMAIEGVLRPRLGADEAARVAARPDTMAPATARGRVGAVAAGGGRGLPRRPTGRPGPASAAGGGRHPRTAGSLPPGWCAQ